MSGPPQPFDDEETKELLLNIIRISPSTKELLSSLASVISNNNISYSQRLLEIQMNGRSVVECTQTVENLISAGSQRRAYTAPQTPRSNFHRQSFPPQSAPFRAILSKPPSTSDEHPAPQPPVKTPKKRGRPPKHHSQKSGDTPESSRRRDSGSRHPNKKPKPTSDTPLQIKPAGMPSARSSIGTNAEMPTPLASAGAEPFSPSFAGYPDPRGPSAITPYAYAGPRAPQSSAAMFPQFPSESTQMNPHSRPPEPRTLWPASAIGPSYISLAPLSRPQTTPAPPPTILPPPQQPRSLPLPPSRYADPPPDRNAPSGASGDSMEQ